jgi:hypothetical protein
MTKLEIITLKAAAKKLYPTLTRARVDTETGDIIAHYIENCGHLQHQHKKKIRISNNRLIEKEGK